MRTPKRQKEVSLTPSDYKVVVVVFGTRHYNDRRQFHEDMCDLVESYEGQPILFVSGAAYSGADRLIIQWCRKFGYPCLEFPAQWEDKKGYNPAAGFERNEKMAKISTFGRGYWDGKSTGTQDMMDRLSRHNVSYTWRHVTISEKKK